MKITLASVSMFLCAVILSGCASTGMKVKEHIDESKIGRYDPPELGSGQFRLEKLLSSELEAKDYSVLYYPDTNTVGLLFKNGLTKTKIRMDKDARDALINAVNAYKDDFENHRLDRKMKKVKEVYGAARVKLEWGPVFYNYWSDPKVIFGYQFVGKSVYFCAKVLASKSEMKADDVVIQNGSILIYMKRSQADELVQALSEENISEVLKSVIIVNHDDADESEVDESADYEEEPDFVRKKTEKNVAEPKEDDVQESFEED